MKLSAILILLLLGLSIQCFSQLSVQCSSKALLTSYSSMNDFRRSYNDYLSDRIDRKLKTFSFGEGYEIGCTYQFGILYINLINYSQHFYNRTVHYLNGAKRQFNMKFNYYSSGLGFGYSNEEDYSIYAYGNIINGSTMLRTYYIYSDGSKDIGLSHQLNGVYSCIISMKPAAGLRFSIPFAENFSIYGYFEYIFPYNIQWNDGDLKFTMQDINDEKIMKNQMMSLPADYGEYQNLGGTWSAYYGQEDSKYVEGDISGLVISLGIKYNIPGSRVE